jgi:hypothetical protein
MQKPSTYTGLEAFSSGTSTPIGATCGPRGGLRVEVWVEKEALAGVIWGVTAE